MRLWRPRRRQNHRRKPIVRHATWFSRNVRHVCEGGFGWRGMYLDTAASETSKPSILSSPWIRGAPHNGFSRDIRRISPRTSLDTGGRPGFPRRDFRVQKRRKPFRCQPITVSGLTITRISLQPDHRRDRTTQKRRSVIRSDGLALFRSKAASCCRRARFSKCNAARLRKASRTMARTIRMVVHISETLSGTSRKCQVFCGR